MKYVYGKDIRRTYDEKGNVVNEMTVYKIYEVWGYKLVWRTTILDEYFARKYCEERK